MGYYERGYDAGEDAGREAERDKRDAAWADSLAPLAAIINAWGLDPAAGMGEPTSPDEVARWVEAIAASFYARLGYASYGDELPEGLRAKYDRHHRDDAEEAANEAARQALMAAFFDAVRSGRPTSAIEHELESLDVPAEWVENTRQAAKVAA